MKHASRYLAEIGRLGGLKSRRHLSPEAARAMVAVREARRAYRRFHAECFASLPPDRQVTGADVAWVVEQLLQRGGESARAVGLRIAGSNPPILAVGVPRDTTRAAEAVRIAALRRRRPADRLREALQLSDTTRALALASLRRRHPQRSDRQLVELLLGGPPGSRTARQ